MNPHVFISYKHEDVSQAFLDELKEQLNLSGISFWRDRDNLRAGSLWSKEIDKAINESFAVMPLITPKSKESAYMTYEWSYAIGIGKRVLPLRLDVSDDDIHPKLLELQMLPFQNGARPWVRVISELNVARDEYSKQIHKELEFAIGKQLYEELRYTLDDLKRPIEVVDILHAIYKQDILLRQDYANLLQMVANNHYFYD
jgi:hypothetical protein